MKEKFDENSNHEEDSSEEKETTNNGDSSTEHKPTDGDGSNNDEANQEFLDKYNQEFDTDFKTVDAIKESKANLENALKENGREKKEEESEEESSEKPAPIQNNNLVQTLFFDKYPEVKDDWEIVEKEAETLGKDPFDLYLSSNLLQKEAKAKFDAKQKKNDANDKMGKPSNQVDSKSDEENPFDKDYPKGSAISNK